MLSPRSVSEETGRTHLAHNYTLVYAVRTAKYRGGTLKAQLPLGELYKVIQEWVISKRSIFMYIRSTVL